MNSNEKLAREVASKINYNRISQNGVASFSEILTAINTATAESEKRCLDLQIRNQELQASIYAHGIYKCGKCNFTQFNSILFAKSGNIAPDLKADNRPCPNDGEKMERVTWESRHDDIAAVCEQQIKRAYDAETQLDASQKLCAEMSIDSPTWPYVLAFAKRMEAKLAKNRHKGDRNGWIKDDPKALFWRIGDEHKELMQAMESGTNEEIANEAADVANFAMMIADIFGGCEPSPTTPSTYIKREDAWNEKVIKRLVIAADLFVGAVNEVPLGSKAYADSYNDLKEALADFAKLQQEVKG